MAVASAQGFVGGTNASPSSAYHPQGLSSRGDGCPTLHAAVSGHTLDADSAECFRFTSPAGAISQTLPTANVKKGKRFTLLVTGATETNYVALSCGGEIDRIAGDGVIEVVSLQDAPTTAAHWRVTNLSENASFDLTATGANTGAIAVLANRQGCAGAIRATLRLTQNAGTMSAAANITGTGVPSRFRISSLAVDTICFLIKDNTDTIGRVRVGGDGSLVALLVPAGNFATSNNYMGQLSGYSCPITYIIA
jgi:hypothetical protein